MSAEAAPSGDAIDARINYSDANKYWKSQPATVNGMLGGFESVSFTDVQGSQRFLEPFLKGPRKQTACDWALDCGAGIGRVSKLLLLPLFKKVDMVEQNGEFLAKVDDHVGKEDAARVCNRYACGLQDFTPEPGRYNLIWVQWVLNHLTDSDFVDFFVRCKAGLAPGGMIGIKENVCKSGRDYDSEDSSSTRTAKHMKKLFKQAGLTLLQDTTQDGFPAGLYPVKMYLAQ